MFKLLDIEACNRAEASEGGFTSSPFFFEDLLDADTIEFKGMTFTKVEISDDETAVKFETINTYSCCTEFKRYND